MVLNHALLQQAGNQLRKIASFVQNKHPDTVNEKIGKVDPQQFSSDLMLVAEDVDSITKALQDPAITSLLIQALKLNTGVFSRLYAAYLNTLGPIGHQLESQKPFNSLLVASQWLAPQLRELGAFVREEFIHYTHIKVEDMQMHTAIIMGLFVRSEDFCSFIAALISLADSTIKHETFPPFLERALTHMSLWMGEFVTLCVQCNQHHQSLTQLLKDYQKSGKNVSMIVQGVPFNEIIGADDIPMPFHQGIMGFMNSDLMSIFLGKASQAERRVDRLEKRLIIKQWLDAQILKARLDLHGADPNSDEAKRLQKAIAAYELELAKISKKIDETPHE